MKSMPRAARRAFTLIELLVVVAIIAVLISILMPALSGAREQAKQLLCNTNLKTQGEAAAFYREDFKGVGICGITDLYRGEYTVYAYSILPYLGNFDGPRVGLWRNVVPLMYEWELPFAFENAKQFQCPTDPVGVDRKTARVLDYVANAMPRVYPIQSIQFDAAGGGPAGDAWAPVSGAPPESYKGMYKMEEFTGLGDSARTVFVTEAHATIAGTSVTRNANGNFRFLHFFLASHLPFGLHPRIANDLRHPGGINSLFFDGHAATMRHDKFDAGYPRSLGLRLRYVSSVPPGYE